LFLLRGRRGEIADLAGVCGVAMRKRRQRPDNQNVSPLAQTMSFYNSEIALSYSSSRRFGSGG
jgi:hypothetical protein